MNRPNAIDVEYFRQYRRELGFTNRDSAKNFLGAKDIIPVVDLQYLNNLDERLLAIVEKIDGIVSAEIKSDNLAGFVDNHISRPSQRIRNNGIVSKLNNQGRRNEQVYFSWMRGFVLAGYFTKAVCYVFDVDPISVKSIGEDVFDDIETFKRTPTADLEITISNSQKIRVEMQAGFTGINDIKYHKIQEAKKVFGETGIQTLVMHVDLFNGQAAFKKLHVIPEDDPNLIVRTQMEGQYVWQIDPNYFVWKITEKPIKYRDLILE